jgi:hypothetical protein
MSFSSDDLPEICFSAFLTRECHYTAFYAAFQAETADFEFDKGRFGMIK